MKKICDSINKIRLSFREKSIIIISFAIMLLIVAVQAYTAYHADITQQKERARLNAKVYRVISRRQSISQMPWRQ